MTDVHSPNPPPASEPPPHNASLAGLDPKSMAVGIYALYLANFLTGISAVAGVIIAYVVRNDAEEWLKSHFEFQIRTFWLAAAGLIIGTILVPLLGVGFLVLVAVALWFLIRTVVGFSYVLKNQPYPTPKNWLV